MNTGTEDLIHRHLDGALTAEEGHELNLRIKNEPDAAAQFARIAGLNHALVSGYQSGTFPTHVELSAPSGPGLASRIVPALPWLAAAAAIAFAIVSIKGHDQPVSPSADSPAELHDTGFAVLTRTVDADWSSSTAPTRGDFLSGDSFHLKSGLVQIEFLSGVSLVVEGDTRFEIQSSEEMSLSSGKLRAHVPSHAIGFQIHTPHGTVLDLGTEFALDLNKDQCELHVFDGEVEWHPHNAHESLLTGGQGLHLSGTHTKTILADPTRFTSPVQLAQEFATHQQDRLTAWKASSSLLSQHPHLVAYFPFDQPSPWGRLLLPSNPDLAPGSIVAAEKVPGRWPGKDALDFSPNGSRVRVTIPGEFQQITFSTWARIDSLDRQFNALFLTDNYEEGEPHWQLTSGGELFFSVRLGGDKLHHINLSPSLWNHAASEQWLHLVTTFDAPSRTTVHYLNGSEISREQAPADKAVPAIRIGNAQIGNWGLPTKNDPGFAVRNLNGRLDEFAIFSTALSPSQVQSLYQSGKP
ncbi:MAG: LamG-like jellyroll fold domain-containing protein [Verrucomicrobiaceae bacterium]